MVRNKNNVYKGIAAAPGVGIAEAYLYSKEKEHINTDTIKDVEEAIDALHEALERSKKELNKVFNLAVDKLGEKRAGIFEAQIMILDDPILISNIIDRIKKEKRTPEFIVADEISKYQDLMNHSKEPYMKERVQDIEDIKNRIIRNLKKKKWKSKLTTDAVVVMENITPADTLLFSKANVKGYVTDFGGLTSHAAILARSLNIPAVVGLHDATANIQNGDVVIVNGFRGEVIVNPTKEQLDYYKEKIRLLNKYDKELIKLKDKKAVTRDGREVTLLSNLDLPAELDIVMVNGADGIGLVRTEQLFADHEEFPDELEQIDFYRDISEKMYPRMVIIRAFDIGGDKVLPFDVKESNPFLGWRGIRFLLDNRSLFKHQIKAVLRANSKNNILFMIPMVASLAEVRKTKIVIQECKEELRKDKIEFNEELKLGIMIEIPSAALMAKEYSQEVNFFSIGTNDLIQYILAVDRGNEIVSDLYQEFHPAVIRTIDYIIKEGKHNDIFVSTCGEMAADPLAIPLLIGLGLDSISVSASVVPLVKKLILSLDYNETVELANECLKMDTEKEIHTRLAEFFDSNLKEQSKDIF